MASAPTKLSRERYVTKNNAPEFKRAFEVLDAKRDGRIDVTELCQFLRERGLKVKKSEAEAMLWEVDEDCDGCVNWAEFRQMYERCQADQTGSEPQLLYHVALFIAFDKQGRGVVTLDDAVQKLLYMEYGREALDDKMRVVCEAIGGGPPASRCLTLPQFLASLRALKMGAPPPAARV